MSAVIKFPEWKSYSPVAGPPVYSDEGYTVVEHILRTVYRLGPTPEENGGVETDAAYLVGKLDVNGFRIVRVGDDDRPRQRQIA